MNDNYYLICLTGMKDIQFKIVDDETFNWIINGKDISENVKEAIMYDHNMSEEELLSWSESHYDNDRAKIVSSIQTFYNVIDLINYINENNINLKEEYRGVMY